MTTLPPIPYSFHEPIPVGEVSERELMPVELAHFKALPASIFSNGISELAHLSTQCPASDLWWKKGVEGMDEMAAYCDGATIRNGRTVGGRS